MTILQINRKGKRWYRNRLIRHYEELVARRKRGDDMEWLDEEVECFLSALRALVDASHVESEEAFRLAS